MREDYKIQGQTQKIEVSVEKETATCLTQMAAHTKLTADELVNTALKRFIATHKDFLPPARR
jgi:hypothetical protein